MHPTEKVVRQFHESWDMRDPERGVAVVADDCRFEDISRGGRQIGPDGYRMDYERWRHRSERLSRAEDGKRHANAV